MLAWLERHQILILSLLGLILVAGILLPRLTQADPDAIVFREGSGLAPGTPIRVHVAGAVLSPGVYDLRDGDRIVDALTAAGGPTDNADLDALNLARRVRDEEQVLIPARTLTLATAAAPLQPGEKLDLNGASAAQLEQLPGIGEAYARRIVDSRKVDGPYKTPQDLVSRRVVPAATFEQIRDLVVVGP